MSDTPAKIEFDARTENLVPDPSKRIDSVVLRGFVGRSTQEGTTSEYRGGGNES
jgi:hypothetical protein